MPGRLLLLGILLGGIDYLCSMKHYDNACKILVDRFSDDLSQWLLGKTYSFTEIQPTDLPSDPIMADTVIFLESDRIILHIEFQTTNDYSIPLRMLDYYVRLQKKFPDKDIRQFVIYLKKTQGTISRQTSFKSKTTSHEFQVIRLWEESPKLFLETKGLLPFATLTQSENPLELLIQVANKINNLENKAERADIASLSAVFAGLILNESDINQFLRSEIMKESSVYQAIVEEGKKTGRFEGRLQEKRDIAMNLFRYGMSLEEIAKITGLSSESLEELIKSIEDHH